MKKVLIITTNSGFLTQFEMNDVKILIEQGYQVHYASNFKKPIYEINTDKLKQQKIILHQIDIEKSPVHVCKNSKALKQLIQIIEKEKIDLIHCHNPIGGVIGRVAAGFSNKEICVIYTAHGFHFYKGAPIKNWLLYYTAESILAHNTDILITINHEDYVRAGHFHLKKHGRVERIPGVGVNIDKFQRKPEKSAEKRKELNIPQEAFHIVSVAELNENKNQKVIIKALARMKQDNIYYSICGKGKTQHYLQKLISKYHLENNVRLLGYRTDIDEILQTADCFAFPSIREGLGIAAIEAMACEIPIIGTDNRGTREYLQDGINGITCYQGTSDEFSEAIQKLYSDPGLRHEMSIHCRKIAEKFALSETDRIMRRIYGEMSGMR